jgi:hypothetical protein
MNTCIIATLVAEKLYPRSIYDRLVDWARYTKQERPAESKVEAPESKPEAAESTSEAMETPTTASSESVNLNAEPPAVGEAQEKNS